MRTITLDHPVVAVHDGNRVTLHAQGVAPIVAGHVRTEDAEREFPVIELTPAGHQWLAYGGEFDEMRAALCRPWQ